MKKFTLLQLVLAVAAGLVIGLFIGMAVNGYGTSEGNLAGSIGKVDRYRNVQVTEDDILLRNELAEDTVKRNQYEKYLMYYYYQSLKTTSDVDKVIVKTQEVPEFTEINLHYIDALTKASASIEKARLDILGALNLITHLKDNQEVPVIDHLNKANNGIARIRSYDELLLDYMNTIEFYIQAHPSKDFPALRDAHDILTLNVSLSAVMTQNKPVLNYLDKKKLLNEKDGVKELIGSNVNLSNTYQNQAIEDIQTLSNTLSAGNNLNVTLDIENLQSFVLDGIENLNNIHNSVEQLNSDNFSSNETLNLNDLGNNEQLQNTIGSGIIGLNVSEALNLVDNN
jgi:hypothetical protein